MSISDVSPILIARLANNRGPSRDDPRARVALKYGVNAMLDGSRLCLSLTFLADSAYCCVELGCHFGLHSPQDWNRLRKELSSCALLPVEGLTVELTAIIKEGALFFDWSRPIPGSLGVYSLAASPAHSYKIVVHEQGESDNDAT